MYHPDSTALLSAPVHSLTISTDEKIILAGDMTGYLTPVEFFIPQSASQQITPQMELVVGDDTGTLPRGIYNKPLQGPLICLDAIATRPLLAVLGEDGSVRYVE